MMNDLWKMWRYLTPREGVIALAGLILASFLIHVMIMTVSERYATGLLG
jgi:hypothetical protein